MQLGGREWTCVLAEMGDDSLVEQWAPAGQLPSRAPMLLSRTRSNGSLGGPPKEFFGAFAEIVAERAFVRPTLQILSANQTTGVGLVALRNDVLMGDSWQIQLAHQGTQISTTCTLEVWDSVPQRIDPSIAQLLVDLVSAPDGVPEPMDGPPLEDVEAAITSIAATPFAEPIEPTLETIEAIARAAEAVPPSVAANLCILQLATWLAAVPGAAFLGFSQESVRLHRIVLRRTHRESQAILWAYSVRGVLLALADVASASEIPALVAACTAAIAKPPVSQIERSMLHHCEGELRLRAADTESHEAAVHACLRSRDEARAFGEGGVLHEFAAMECLARAYRKLGREQEEIAALREALSIAPESRRAELEARLRDLARERSPEVTEPWAAEFMEWYRQQTPAEEPLLLSPFRRPAGINVLVLRPLVTAQSRSVPNRFVHPLRHAWRFRDEPPAMTFEETLSRALGHRCSFVSRGGAVENFGIGRTAAMPSAEARDPESWRNAVEVMVADALISQLVIIYPSDSPGMQWELDLLAARPNADQARLFMIPPDIDAHAAQKQWQASHSALASRGLAIPDWNPDGLIFAHDQNGAVAWTDTFSMLWEGRLATWVETAA